jgi:hypothetical protein
MAGGFWTVVEEHKGGDGNDPNRLEADRTGVRGRGNTCVWLAEGPTDVFLRARGCRRPRSRRGWHRIADDSIRHETSSAALY